MLYVPPIGWGASAAGVTFSLTETDSSFDGANATTYTFLTQDFGAADSNRYIAVGIVSRGSAGAARTVDSVTIGGVSASQVVGSGASGDGYLADIWLAAVPTGTTGTVAITFSGGMLRCGISVSRLITSNSTATDTGSDIVAASNALSDTLVIPSGGGGIGIVIGNGTAGNPRTWTWTNLTEQADGTIEGDVTFSSALSTTAGSVTVTATASGALSANDACALALAAWGL